MQQRCTAESLPLNGKPRLPRTKTAAFSSAVSLHPAMMACPPGKENTCVRLQQQRRHRRTLGPNSMKPNDPSQAPLDKVKHVGRRHQSCLCGFRLQDVFPCSAVSTQQATHPPIQPSLVGDASKGTARELLFSNSGRCSCLMQPPSHL